MGHSIHGLHGRAGSPDDTSSGIITSSGISAATPSSPQGQRDVTSSTSTRQATSSVSAAILSPLEVVIESTRKNLRELEDELKGCEDSRSSVLHEFNVLRKALNIVLDESLLQLAILGDSLLRKATNYFAHKKNDKSDIVLDALKWAQEVIEKAGMSDDADADADAGAFDIQKETDKLVLLLYDSDDYFDKRDQTIELAVDNYLAVVNEGILAVPANHPADTGRRRAQESRVSDFHILLQCLDTLYPIPAHAQE